MVSDNDFGGTLREQIRFDDQAAHRSTPPAAKSKDRVPGALGPAGPLIMTMDAATLAGALKLALMTGVAPVPGAAMAGLFLAGATLALVLLASGGSYRSRLHLSVLDESPGILGRVLVTAALVELGASIFTATTGYLAVYALAGVSVLAGRSVAYAIIHTARRRRIARHRTLIVGAGAVGTSLATQLLEDPRYGLEPVAFFDADPLPQMGGPAQSIPIIRNGNVANAISATGARVVIVAFMSAREASLVSVIRDCGRMETEIFCVPRLFELSSDEGVQMDRVGSVPLLRMRRNANRSLWWNAKRAFDIVFALSALLLLSPLLAALALGVLLTNGRPVLFKQVRLSQDSKPFEILKFRSLPPAATAVSDSDWNYTSRPPNRFGLMLRRYSLDELPQLWNIVVGDMSVVGPRPERPMFVDEFSGTFPGYRDRHRVRAGLTGLAQVEGCRGDTSIARRAQFDNSYVESWTLWGDIKIIIRTINSVLRRDGK